MQFVVGVCPDVFPITHLFNTLDSQRNHQKTWLSVEDVAPVALKSFIKGAVYCVLGLNFSNIISISDQLSKNLGRINCSELTVFFPFIKKKQPKKPSILSCKNYGR